MDCQNRLFVAYKPSGVSSNRFLSSIKRRYGVKKAGFSGTLDPFAKGVLIIAFGQYTKLFQFLDKAPKKYRATLFLGAKSESLDIERVYEVLETPRFNHTTIESAIKSLIGEISYYPPKFSAKKVDGKRAYELARMQEEFKLKKIRSLIYDMKLLSYMHPFLTFEVTISEGGYIRSIGEILAKRLGSFGILSALERIEECRFRFEDEKSLDPTGYLKIKENFYLSNKEDIVLGKKLSIDSFKFRDEGEYFIKFDTILSIISIKDGSVKYRLNGVKIC